MESEDYFQKLMYTENNEDLEFIVSKLGIKRNDRVAVVTSSGCVAFASLLYDPSSVVGFDINEVQTAYAVLRKEAHKKLELEKYREFLGYKEAGKSLRIGLYRFLAKTLPEETADFWDNNISWIADGVVNQSYFYKKMRMVAKWSKLFKKRGFKHTIGLIEAVKQNLPSEKLKKYAENYDLEELILHGNKDPSLMRIFENIKDYTPPYLEGKNFPRIKNNINKVKFFTCSMTEGLKNLDNIDICYLSNIMDYLTQEQNKILLYTVEKACNTGAKILALQRTNNFNLKYFVKDSKLKIKEDNLARESRAIAYKKNPYAKISLLRKT